MMKKLAKLLLVGSLALGAAVLRAHAAPTSYAQMNSTRTQTGGFHTSTGTVDSFSCTTCTVQNINTTFIGLGRNRLINGDMRISQRNGVAVSTSSTGTSTYYLDKWKISSSTDTAWLVVQSTIAPTGFDNSMLITISTADLSMAQASSYRIFNAMEGNSISDFLLGTPNARMFTVSFWVRCSSTGTFGGVFKNSANDRSYPFTYIISSTNTWTYETVTATGDVTGTWPTDTSRTMMVTFSFGTGSSANRGNPGSWQSGNLNGATGEKIVAATQGLTWYLTGVQVELGSSPTAFEYPSYQEQLFRCQRYYEKSYAIITTTTTNTTVGAEVVSAAQVAATTMLSNFISYKVPKRITPTTLTLYQNEGAQGFWVWTSTSGVSTARATSVSSSNLRGFNVTQTVAVEYSATGQWIADDDF